MSFILYHEVSIDALDTTLEVATNFAAIYIAFLAFMISFCQEIPNLALQAIDKIALLTIWKLLRTVVTPVVQSEHTIFTTNCNKICVKDALKFEASSR
jgi:hypothetical protein